MIPSDPLPRLRTLDSTRSSRRRLRDTILDRCFGERSATESRLSHNFRSGHGFEVSRHRVRGDPRTRLKVSGHPPLPDGTSIPSTFPASPTGLRTGVAVAVRSNWSRSVVEWMMERLRLPVNAPKTRCLRVPEEPMEFLGYLVGRNHDPRTGVCKVSAARSVCRRRRGTGRCPRRMWPNAGTDCCSGGRTTSVWGRRVRPTPLSKRTRASGCASGCVGDSGRGSVRPA